MRHNNTTNFLILLLAWMAQGMGYVKITLAIPAASYVSRDGQQIALLLESGRSALKRTRYNGSMPMSRHLCTQVLSASAVSHVLTSARSPASSALLSSS